MSIGKVTRNFQVTIPAEIRKALRINVGSLVDFVFRKGEVILKPKTVIDQEQSYFWTKEWQQGEKEVDNAIRKGEITEFKNIDELRKRFEK